MRGRIRTIKPEAFLDEDLWDLEEETGLPIFRAFFGIVCHADREGRFEWRPRALKAVCLPYWSGEFSRVLDACLTRGLLVKYASGGREYGLIPSFTRHQSINGREEASKLPPPPEPEAIPDTSTRAPRVDDACPTRPGSARGEGKGREGNPPSREPREDPGAEASIEHRAGMISGDLWAEWSRLRKADGRLPDKRSGRVVREVAAQLLRVVDAVPELREHKGPKPAWVAALETTAADHFASADSFAVKRGHDLTSYASALTGYLDRRAKGAA